MESWLTYLPTCEVTCACQRGPSPAFKGYLTQKKNGMIAKGEIKSYGQLSPGRYGCSHDSGFGQPRRGGWALSINANQATCTHHPQEAARVIILWDSCMWSSLILPWDYMSALSSSVPGEKNQSLYSGWRENSAETGFP